VLIDIEPEQLPIFETDRLSVDVLPSPTGALEVGAKIPSVRRGGQELYWSFRTPNPVARAYQELTQRHLGSQRGTSVWKLTPTPSISARSTHHTSLPSARRFAGGFSSALAPDKYRALAKHE